MTSRTGGILLMFLLYLICCSAANQQPHRRQKRGLVKMMMHIMWDPVRLIRYWYAYDVTKEIAKSWRKIIPTMVLHPYLAGTPGVAKYLHPTYGLGRTKKQPGQFNYPDEASRTDSYSDTQLTNDYIQSLVQQSESLKSAYSTNDNSYGVPHKQIILESASSMDSQPSFKLGHQYGGNPEHIHDTSFVVEHEDLEDHKDAHHVYLQPFQPERIKRGRAPTRQLGNDNGQNAVAIQPKFKPFPFPYKVAVPSSAEDQHIVLKAVPMPTFLSSAEVVDGSDYAASPSFNIDSARKKNTHFGAPPAFVQVQQDTKSHVAYSENQDHHQSSQTGHQEIHIVLHPIPVEDPSQHSLGKPGQAVHYVPYNYNLNKSSLDKGGPFPFIFPAVIGSSESASSHEEQSSPPSELQAKPVVTLGTEKENLDVKNNSSTSAEVYDAKQTSRVTWVLKQDKDSSRRKDPKMANSEIDSSDAKVSTLDAKDGFLDHTSQHPLRLKGHRIDLEQLREDLKHGTPVLIPFDKNVKLSQNFEKSTNHRNPLKDDHLNIRGEIQYDSFNLPKGSMKTDDIGTETRMPQYSNEEHSGSNSTQKLILFLARKHSSQYRR